MKEWMDLHFNSQYQIYEAKKIQRDGYSIVINPFINDSYWNLGYIENENIENFTAMWNDIKNVMKKYNRQPIIYITTNLDLEKLEEQIKENKLQKEYTDRWLKVGNLEKVNLGKAKIDIKIKQVNKDEQDEFINTVFEVFSSDNPNDPYQSLSEEYIELYKRIFKQQEGIYKVKAYLAKYNEIPIASANVIYNKNKALIYSVGTKKEFKQKGVCRQMIGHIIEDMRQIGVQEVGLQTEAGFYTEQVYKNLGFTYLMDGIAYTK